MPQSADDEYGPGRLRVTVSRQGAVRVVSVSGELDHDTGEGLRAALVRPWDEGEQRTLVDLADLRFCDSTGLNILLRARLVAEADGRQLEVAGPTSAVARLFAVTGADTVLRIHPDLGTALRTAGPAHDTGDAQ
ncbi:STAS domain-containing protein [Kitasatospora sp. NPDC056076]|uniref:STAS domain-containing protein n=1 Tax=Kitasatospora sp. NPDC056076 TaxID=3345703 RepID=UPI0035E3B471